jgi:hypothetical protein
MSSNPFLLHSLWLALPRNRSAELIIESCVNKGLVGTCQGALDYQIFIQKWYKINNFGRFLAWNHFWGNLESRQQAYDYLSFHSNGRAWKVIIFLHMLVVICEWTPIRAWRVRNLCYDFLSLLARELLDTSSFDILNFLSKDVIMKG